MLLFVTTTMSAQIYIDLSNMTETIHLGENDCSGEQTHYITTGDVNLNGHKIELEYVFLEVMGDINGHGKIHGHQGCDTSTVYVQGVVNTSEHVHPHLPNYIKIQDNVEITSDPLRVETEVLLPRVHYVYNRQTKVLSLTGEQEVRVYNTLGQLLISEFTDAINLSQLDNAVVIVRTKNGGLKLLR